MHTTHRINRPLTVQWALDPHADAQRGSLHVKVNSHVHLPPNFSAFSSIEQLIRMAVEENVRVLGVTNYYDYAVYRQFSNQADQARIFPLFGLEIISRVEELAEAGVKINDPNNPGRMYICGKGTMNCDPVPPAAMGVLEKIRHNDVVRMERMVEKTAAAFVAARLGLEVSELSIRTSLAQRYQIDMALVYLQERHIAQAFQEAMFDKVPAEDRAEFLTGLYGQAPKAPVGNAIKTQIELRSNLLKAGKAAFVEEGFVSYPEARKMILAMGGIPCYPTLADGADPICAFEDPLDQWVDQLRKLEIPMAEMIPLRNTPEVLGRYVLALRRAGIVVVGGTEHNTPELVPLEPMCVGNQPVPPYVQTIFEEGACVVAAHQFLTAHGECGYVDQNGRPNPNYKTTEERITTMAGIGQKVIAKTIY